jgi:hypothetical protein
MLMFTFELTYMLLEVLLLLLFLVIKNIEIFGFLAHSQPA